MVNKKLSDIYLERTLIEKDTCTSIFIAALHKCQDMEASVDRRMDKDSAHLYIDIHISVQSLSCV